MTQPLEEERVTPYRPTEQDKLEAWRLQQLLDAGYPIPLAERLAARRDIDLHHALDLLARGCRPQLAGQILL